MGTLSFLVGWDSPIFYVAVLAYCLRFLWVTQAWQGFLCPRCDEPYIKGGWASPLDLFPGRRCRHCSLDELSDEWRLSAGDLNSLHKPDDTPRWR